MKTVGALALCLLVVFGLAVITSGDTVLAQAEEVKRGVDTLSGGNTASAESTLETIVNTFLFIIGALSVVMIVYGGFRYVTSAGESSAVSAAKNTILYAVVGLVIALCAYAISDFVIDIFSGEGGIAAPAEDTSGGNSIGQ